MVFCVFFRPGPYQGGERQGDLLMSAPEPWRRTGRKAADDHWLGLEALTLVEVSLYDDAGRQQGRGLLQLQQRGTEVQPGEGQTWLSRFVGIEGSVPPTQRRLCHSISANAKLTDALTPQSTATRYMWMCFELFQGGAMRHWVG